MVADFEGIPQELRDRDQWVCWKAKKTKKKDGTPKTDKIPIDAKTGRNASTTDPSTWSSFLVAHAAAPKYSGVGFVFTQDDPYVGIDFDGVRKNGICNAQTVEATRSLGSYGEVSQSGEGVHVILKGCLPSGPRRKDPVEVYSEARFFALTGDRLPWCPKTVETRQEALEAFYRGVFGEVATGSVPAGVDRSELDEMTEEIQRLIEGGRTSGFPADVLTAMINADKVFGDTWNRKRKDFGDDSSRYDASLAYLGVMSDLDVEMICRLITDHRKLHRDDPKCKTLRADYLARTILAVRSGEVTQEAKLLSMLDQQDVDDAKAGGRERIVDEIRMRTGIETFAGMAKYGSEESVYFMTLTDGTRFKLGGAEVLMELRKVEKPVFNATGLVIREQKPHQWRKVARLLHAVTEFDQMEDLSREEQVREWVEAYTESGHVYDAGDRQASPEAVAEDGPFIRGERLYLRPGRLKHYVTMVLGDKVTTGELKVMLKETGFRGERVYAKHPEDGRPLCRYYYYGSYLYAYGKKDE